MARCEACRENWDGDLFGGLCGRCRGVDQESQATVLEGLRAAQREAVRIGRQDNAEWIEGLIRKYGGSPE